MIKRVAGVSIAFSLLIGTLASPAYATKPARGCGEAFDLRTIQSIAEEGEEVTGVPAEVIAAAIEGYDKNDDDLLCFMIVPSVHGGNAVDNTANR